MTASKQIEHTVKTAVPLCFVHNDRRFASKNAHRLRSSSSLPVAYRPATVGRRSFPVAASIHCNNLPPYIQSHLSLTDFCH